MPWPKYTFRRYSLNPRSLSPHHHQHSSIKCRQIRSTHSLAVGKGERNEEKERGKERGNVEGSFSEGRKAVKVQNHRSKGKELNSRPSQVENGFQGHEPGRREGTQDFCKVVAPVREQGYQLGSR